MQRPPEEEDRELAVTVTIGLMTVTAAASAWMLINKFVQIIYGGV